MSGKRCQAASACCTIMGMMNKIKLTTTEMANKVTNIAAKPRPILPRVSLFTNGLRIYARMAAAINGVKIVRKLYTKNTTTKKTKLPMIQCT